MFKLFLLLIIFTNHLLSAMTNQDLNETLKLKIQCKDATGLRRLSEKGIKPNAKHLLDCMNYPNFDLKFFDVLIECGANINEAIDEHGNNLAHFLLDLHPLETNDLLPHFFEKGLEINAVNNDGYNLLHILLINDIALKITHYPPNNFIICILKNLISRGINIYIKNRNGLSPISISLMKLGDPSIKRLLNDLDTFILEHEDDEGFDYATACQIFIQNHDKIKKVEVQSDSELQNQADAEQQKRMVEQSLEFYQIPPEKKRKKRCIIM